MADAAHTHRPDRLLIAHREVDGIRVVTVRGEIDHDVRDTFSQALALDDTTGPTRTVVDLSGVPFMDSSGVNVLLALYRTTRDTEGWLRIAGARPPVLRILQVLGIDAVIACHPTLEQALAS
ncbi:STAS domain-containing protein [Streptomyces griseomycini]|uniref:Anti-sigma factor antagonist n=1 Tax=Streptomyces griseomycini TaxID=66895 RepID=A0A7W7PY06_9ACTN|nr:STAS domain-containing protein [Streptomyces griseomycini]MBB4903364.1 anti-anti-sigma factor [Streptomyces griseomycini]GGQ36027.1 hypothetical protein GCM10010266_69190 [Streptomyces griseomycini]GGR53901.1 hypothetical protein GCM10015536_69080 [Streptomyces griseomycini]